jgi:hypothetical protein
MVTADDIRASRTVGDDYAETQRLKEKLRGLRGQRIPFFLTAAEFEEILHWKLRGQFGRQKQIRAVNTDVLIRTVTGCAFSIQHEEKDYEVELRLKILSSLRGVGVPVASAILALTFPHAYAVIDFRGWRQIFGDKRNSFSVEDYQKYVKEVRRLALELGWPVQEVDLAIWAYDMKTHGG